MLYHNEINLKREDIFVIRPDLVLSVGKCLHNRDQASSDLCPHQSPIAVRMGRCFVFLLFLVVGSTKADTPANCSFEVNSIPFS